MKSFFLVITLLWPVSAFADAASLVIAARARTQADVLYDGSYVRLSYPGGDISKTKGVCTDVIIRAYRTALEFDFQKAVHEDMTAQFESYPTFWGLAAPDSNIDHRRVPNLETYLTRQGAALEVRRDPAAFQPGDLVTWRLDNRLPHIGIVSDKLSDAGIPLIIHNVGAGPREEDVLFAYPMTGHFRFMPASNTRESR